MILDEDMFETFSYLHALYRKSVIIGFFNTSAGKYTLDKILQNIFESCISPLFSQAFPWEDLHFQA